MMFVFFFFFFFGGGGAEFSLTQPIPLFYGDLVYKFRKFVKIKKEKTTI